VSNEVVVALISAVGIVLAAVIGLVGTVVVRKLNAAKAAALQTATTLIEVGDKVFAVGEQVDGRLSELLREARALARAEGVAQGEQSQRDRAAASDVPHP
jgi:hypothetical protein